MKFERFEDIEAWKKARLLTSEIYKITSGGELARDYSLRDQLRRASVSILSNIAEGFERGGNKEFYQFLALAKGSCGEVRAQLYVALDQHYINQQQFKAVSDHAVEVSRIVSGLMKYLKQSEMRGAKYKSDEFKD